MNRSKEEIDEILNWAYEGIDAGSKFPGSPYEQGVAAAIEWIQGDNDLRPDGNN